MPEFDESSFISSAAGEGALTALGGPAVATFNPDPEPEPPAAGVLLPPQPPEAQNAVEAEPEPLDDVDYLLQTFKVDDIGLRDADGTVDRAALEALLASHRHLIADRIRFPGA